METMVADNGDPLFLCTKDTVEQISKRGICVG